MLLLFYEVETDAKQVQNNNYSTLLISTFRS